MGLAVLLRYCRPTARLHDCAMLFRSGHVDRIDAQSTAKRVVHHCLQRFPMREKVARLLACCHNTSMLA